ncbi:MAG: hypothetical protein QXL94_08195 [Candidatus Parvarchaeum sp.]
MQKKKYEILFENFKKEWEKAREPHDSHGAVIVLFGDSQVYTDYYERYGKLGEGIVFYEGNNVKLHLNLDEITGVKTVTEEKLRWEEIMKRGEVK